MEIPATSREIWPALFIPHGGGPCFFVEPRPPWPRNAWDGMAAFLRGIGTSLGQRPRAVLVISAHWETERLTVNTASAPSLLFDYYGFPEHTYRLTYPAPGFPALADEVRTLLAGAGFAADADSRRGLDHGVFVPFKLVYPDADVPLVQLPLRSDLDPAAHLEIGRALAPLRGKGVLIVGAGLSFHDVQAFNGEHDDKAEAFDAWLGDAAADPGRREAALTGWRFAPGAMQAHPRAEHLLPLMVAAGAARGDKGTRIYADHVFGKPVSGFRFGEVLDG